MRREADFSAFWREDCRGIGLRHKHGQHVGARLYFHDDCPCRECGVTPLVWSRLNEYARQIPHPDDEPLELMEPRLATGICAGPADGPGRGGLSPRWVEWALNYNWPQGGR